MKPTTTPIPSRQSSPRAKTQWYASTWTAAALLAVFFGLLVSSVSHVSLTFDELGHSTAGYTYWKFNDYRFDPENGNLPQRIIGLPLALSADIARPSTDSDAWRISNVWSFGYQWYHSSNNDVAAMLRRGRMAIALVTVALGVLVWAWSRRRFGPAAGWLSLLLFVLSPTVLANGGLMTSDATVALFFFCAVGALWAVLHRLTAGRLAASLLAVAALFVTKASALLIVPMAATLVLARLIKGDPWPINIGRPREITSRLRLGLVLLVLALAHLVAVWFAIWASVGFRFSPFADTDPGHRLAQSWAGVLAEPDPLTLLPILQLTPEQASRAAEILKSGRLPQEAWAPERVALMNRIRREVLTPAQSQRLDSLLSAPPHAWSLRTIETLHRHRLLPEAYLYGMAHVLSHAQLRNAFWNGEVRLDGWRLFFPYTFLVKTPLPMLALMVLALGSAWVAWRRLNYSRAALAAGFYATLPLWTLLVWYWSAVISSPLNIGHRHILPTYPPLFVLCGVAAAAWESRRRTWRIALHVLLAALAAETLYRYPNYLAYFNVIAGGPDHAYRHLVDSSLDWGQDLPALRNYLERQRIAEPVYLSYFGNGNPASYGLQPRSLYSYDGQHVLPAMQLLPYPVGEAKAAVTNELQQHPDYEVAGSSRGPNNTIGVLFLKKAEALRLAGGTYFVSASMLQPVMYPLDGPLGPWNARFEVTYQDLSTAVKPLLQDDAETRLGALRQHRPSEWQDILQRFEMFRFARLSAFLRQREPTDNINGSILVYRLTDEEVKAAIDGPAPELGPDVPRQFASGAIGATGEANH